MIRTAALVAAVSTTAASAQVVVPIELEILVGNLAGFTSTGTVTYDVGDLTGVGVEVVASDMVSVDFSLPFNGSTLSAADDFFGFTLFEFTDGELTGLNFFGGQDIGANDDFEVFIDDGFGGNGLLFEYALGPSEAVTDSGNGVIRVVPTPGAAAVVALGGLAAIRRR